MTTNENRSPSLGWAAGGALLLLMGLIVWRGWFAPAGKEEDAVEKKEAATARIRVGALTHGTIERTLTVYGTVIIAPGGTRSLSFPYECRVVAVTATVGQAVAQGDPLLQIEPSVDARLALDSARVARDAADLARKDLQDRLKARLATNQDLAAAEAAARDARLKFESLQGRTPGLDGLVRAPAAGVVTKLAIQPGAVVQAGGALVEVAVENQFEARLGIAPPDAADVRPGQGVHLLPVQSHFGGEDSGGLAGTVRVVGRSVDPATRLVDTFVTLEKNEKFSGSEAAGQMLIGTYLRAEIVVEKKEALLAPRAAVLPLTEEYDEAKPADAAKAAPDEAGVLYVIEKSHATKHEVKTGINDGRYVEIIGGGEALKVGANVVTQGNPELEDGMAVEILEREGKPDAPERAAPAGTPAMLDKADAGETVVP